MSLLVPAFLLGLLALAIPLWVHLRNRPKHETIDFPSLMFLQEIPYRSVQQQQLRHRMVFAARALALALMALAFARPFFAAGGIDSAIPLGAREVVIVLDHSWSMGYADRWARARAAAQQAIDELAAGDRGSLVLFAEEPRVLAESESDPAALSAALAAATLDVGTTRFAAGLRAARRILGESSQQRRAVVLISDFQKTGWQADALVEMPAGTTVEPIDVGGPAPNVSVSEVSLRGENGSSAVVVTARVTSQGQRDTETLVARLQVDGASPQTRTVKINANDSVRVSFDAIDIGAGGAGGTVSIGEDPLSADNDFYFVIAPGQQLRALIVENPGADAEDSLFVEQALGIGSNPGFALELTTLDELDAETLAGYALVLLNDSGEPDASTAAALGRYVEGGGGVLVALGELWSSATEEAAWLPFAIGAAVDRTVELGATLSYLDTSHPALGIFAGAGSGDFTATRYYRYHGLEPQPTAGVLARFDDGHPALVEVPAGSGRLLVWTTTLDTFWNDFALQPVFLPFIRQIGRYTAGYREPRRWLRAGGAVAVGELVAAAATGPVSRASDGAVELDTMTLPTTPGSGGVRLEPGVHTVSWTGDDGTVASGLVAVNLDRAEADLSPIDPEEVAASVVWRGGGSVEQQGEQAPSEDQVERAQSIWWYLLIVVFILLAVETALSNRVSPRAS